jgi:DnaJ-class molecular chaperone
MNFYAVLGIPQDADEPTIRNAYRILARRYHPDRGVGSSPEKFRLVNEAYETLIHRERRQAYDVTLHRAERTGPIPTEPLAARREFFRREDPAVFGRFESLPRGGDSRSSHSIDDVLEDWLHSLDDWLSGPEWP